MPESIRGPSTRGGSVLPRHDMDSDQAVTIEIEHDDKLTDEDGVCIHVLF